MDRVWGYWIIGCIVYGIIFSIISHDLAVRKGYTGFYWLGLFFGIFTFLYVVGLPLAEDVRQADILQVLAQVEREKERKANPAVAPRVQAVKKSIYSNNTRHDSNRRVECPHCGETNSATAYICAGCNKSIR